MTGIFNTISSSFFVTQLSVSSIILTVFALSASLFFLRGENKSSATTQIGFSLMLLALFHFFYFISFSFYHPLTIYHRWFTVTFIFLSQIHMSRFIFQYPDNRNSELSRIIMYLQYAYLVPLIIWYCIYTQSAQHIFRFDGHYWDFSTEYADRLIGLVIICNSIFHAVILVLRLFQLRDREFYWMFAIGSIFVLGALIPAVLNSMNREGLVKRESFQTALNMCHLFSFTLLSLMHLNTTRDRFTFMGKIVGISSVTFLAVFILNSHFTLREMNSLFEKYIYSDTRIYIHEGLYDSDLKYINSYSFKNNSFITNGKSSQNTPYTGYEFFNTAVLEEIKTLPDHDFDQNLKKITANGDIYFSGYKNLIAGIDRSIPSGYIRRGEEIFRRIYYLQSYILFNYNYIMNLPDSRFRENMLKHLAKTSPRFSTFKDAIILYTSTSELQGGELKREVLKFIEAMQYSGSQRYRTGFDGHHYVSSIYYDKKEGIVYEAGFNYLIYRRFMHVPAARTIALMVFVMLFIILIYPFFFFWTLYKPLHSLRSGVKRVIDGELDFSIPVYSEDEIGFITGTFNKMVSRLKANNETIFRSENRFRELNDLLPDFIYETDMDLNITYMNKAGLDKTGYSAREMAKGISFRRMLKTEELELLENFVKNSCGERTKIFSMTHDLITESGNILKAENRAVFIFDNGTASGLRGIIRDVTDKVRTEEALLQLQKMESIGTLTAGLAHDFNNILGGITGPLSLLSHSIKKHGSPDPEELGIHLKTMDESVRRATDLVQQLVFISRREAPLLIPVNIASSIDHVIRICTSAFDKSIEIVKDVPDCVIMIKGDPTQLEQMLLNICINANHAMTIMRKPGETRGGRLTISVTKINSDEHFAAVHPESTENAYWTISITDTGIGMSSDTISKVFIPFFTTKERGSGTGLGLSMVYNIIRHHKGFINIYSEPGSGTNVTLYIPVLDDKDAEAGKVISPVIPHGEGIILVADDEESIRLTARLMLERCGYTVITASDGEEAVNIYRQYHSEIKGVLLDLVMPRMSGEQVYIELTAINPEVRVLLASGMLNDDRVEKLSVNRHCMFIQKPYTFENLAGAVNTLLNV